MLAQALEERSHCLDVSCRIGVENDHTVEVGRHQFQVLSNLVDNLTNHSGEALLPWGAASHSYRHVGAQTAVGGTVSLRANLMQRRNQVDHGNTRPLPKESWSTRGMGYWLRLPISLSLV